MALNKPRYLSFNRHLRAVFGEKVATVALDGGFSCPNRHWGLGGCIYCSPRGSGDFVSPAPTISRQFKEITAKVHEKWPQTQKFIAYFQAFTNTWAPVARLRDLYQQALAQQGVVGLAIATRPDCLPPEILDLLAELNEQTYLWLELGLQSSHDCTLKRINRGHDFACFQGAALKLKARGIRTSAHIILGLPGETAAMMQATAAALAELDLAGIKIHLLNVLRGTALAAQWDKGKVPLPTMAEYAGWVVDILELLPPQMVVQRLTGDCPAPLLLAPAWSLRKWETLMAIEAELERRDAWQGKRYKLKAN